MNFIFKSSPTHPWFPGWVLEPRNCTTGFHERKHESFFQTLPELGKIGPYREEAEWSLQLAFSAQAKTHLLFNGFGAYQIKRKSPSAVEMVVPEPGVLWGHYFNGEAPQLVTKKSLEKGDDYEWMESDEQSVLLLRREAVFCLVSKAYRREDALELAEKYMEQDLEAHLKVECEMRKGSCQLFERFMHYDALAMLCSETMMRAIRPPEGNILTQWSQSSRGDAQLDVNEVPVLAMAWRHLNPSMARELLLGVLRLQNNAGALPVLYAPHKTFSLLESPKPMLAKTAEKVWEAEEDATFLTEVIPLLRRHIQWLLHHFDPQRKGVYSWQSKNESFDPQEYKSELVTVDVLALLLSEIAALNRLQNHSPKTEGEEDVLFFMEERIRLEELLEDQFWNKRDARFNRAYLRDKQSTVEGFQEFLPLLLKDLPETKRSSVLHLFYHSNLLPGSNEMLSWRGMSPDQTTFPLLQQLILLDILEIHDAKGAQARDFTRLLLQGFMEWHTTALSKNQPLVLDPAMAAFIVTLMATHHYRDQDRTLATHLLGKIQQKLKISRFDMGVIGVALFLFIGFHFIYDQKRQLPPFDSLIKKMDIALVKKDVNEMVKNATMIEKFYPEKAEKAEFLLANLALMKKDFPKAEALFLKVREKVPDSPAPMVFLGMTYQQQGKFDKANEQYDEFTFLFDEIFPPIVKRIQEYQYMMEEGFKSPPGWRSLYNYKSMNELEPSE